MAQPVTPEQIRAAEELLDQARSRMYQVLVSDVGSEPSERRRQGQVMVTGPRSSADRDRVTAWLRGHFADGGLTSGELDERISAAQ
jgi:Domain of unknown function (DUF1707)